MKKLFISNYKSINKLEIKDLKAVNLFTGKNNTGKSSLLEALSLFASKVDMQWIYYLLDTREEVKNYRRSDISEESNVNILSSLFFNRETSISYENQIEIKSDLEKIQIKFVRYFESKVYATNDDGEKIFTGVRRNIVEEDEQEEYPMALEISVNEQSKLTKLDRDIFFRRSLNTKNNFHFVNTTGDEVTNSSKLWDQITLSDKENYVIDALKIIEPSIHRLSFIGEENGRSSRYPIVKLINSDNIYPLRAMGDGINRVLNLILALVNSDNGYLFIDEFENGLHYSVQEKLWEIIFDLSSKLNIQVFVTTHSNDTITSFSKVLSENDTYDGSLHRLARTDNGVKSYSFSKEEIEIASQQHINLR